MRSRDPSSHKLSHQITLQKSVTLPANQRQDDENMVYGRLFCPRHYAPTDGNLQKQQQQKDEQAQGTTQKKKKVTAAQLRVQKGSPRRKPEAGVVLTSTRFERGVFGFDDEDNIP